MHWNLAVSLTESLDALEAVCEVRPSVEDPRTDINFDKQLQCLELRRVGSLFMMKEAARPLGKLITRVCESPNGLPTWSLYYLDCILPRHEVSIFHCK